MYVCMYVYIYLMESLSQPASPVASKSLWTARHACGGSRISTLELTNPVSAPELKTPDN